MQGVMVEVVIGQGVVRNIMVAFTTNVWYNKVLFLPSLCGLKDDKDAHMRVKKKLRGHSCNSYRHITACWVL